MRAHQVALQVARSRHVGVWNHGRIVSSTIQGSGWNAAPIHRFQTRSYVFVPTSWEEWKRLFVSRSKRRTIMVKFFRDQSQAVSSQWTSAKKQFQSHYLPQDGKLRLQRWVRAKQRRTQIRAESFATAISLKKKTQWVKQRVVSTKTTAMQWREQSQAMARRWREHGRVTARRWRDKMRQMYTRHISSSPTSFQPKTHLFQRHNSSTVTTATSSASIASAPSLVQTVTLTEYSQADWFDADGYPLTSRDGDRFVNPWMSESTNGVKSLQYVWNWRTQRLERIWRELGWKSFIPSIKLPWWKSSSALSSSMIQHSNNNKYHQNVMGSVPRPLSSLLSTPPKRDRIRMTWIGHSTCLVEMAGATILTDPIFSHRASPLQYVPAGVPRHTPAACTVDDLPTTIDICLISHDHYDHLDKNSVLELRQKVQLWVVPLGIKEWLKQSCQIPNERIVELEWWESVALYRNANTKSSSATNKKASSSSSTYGSSSHHQQLQVGGTFHWPHKAVVTPDLQITCAPTQHWSCRSMWDRNTRLWCSWALYDHTNQQGGGGGVSSFYFGGDSGYPEEFPLFRQIGQRLGPFDLSALPIGAYEPSYFMKDAHVHPTEAVQIHTDILSKKSVGIHWGSFALAEEGNDEPPRLLQEETIRAKRANEPPIDFTVIGMGESIESVPHRSEPSIVELREDDDDVYEPKASVGA